ncbi:MAG: hypothetical protein V1809_05425 [Planctomycetota bacterium]
MKKSHPVFRGLLWVIGTYHIIIGLLFNGPRDILIQTGHVVGGITLMPEPGVFHLAKPFGIYLIAFGVAMWMAAWNPIKNRAIISLAVILFGLRIAQRLITFRETTEIFGISAARNTTMILTVAIFTVALAFFRLQLRAELHDDTARGTRK